MLMSAFETTEINYESGDVDSIFDALISAEGLDSRLKKDLYFL